VERWCLLAALFVTTPAHAYVRSVNSNGTQVHWPTSCVVLSPDARGDQSPDSIDLATFEDTLARAVGNWNSRIGSCSYMKLGVTRASVALDAVSDGRPAVVFRSDVWGRNGMMYDESAIGLTTVWSADRDGDPSDGLINDADIELNAVNFTFTVTGQDTARPHTKLEDLENTLTHELGHVLGLAHTCWDHKAKVHDMDVQPVDNNGNLVPDCFPPPGVTLPDQITQATMWPLSPPGFTGMRNLSDDDVHGVCDVYPSTDNATPCYGYLTGNGCAESAVHWPATETSAWSSLMAAAVSIFVLLFVTARMRR
jgi:hypothetical protein